MNVTFCGHSQITKADNIANWLRNVTQDLIEQGATTFYLGGYGEFDSLAASILREQKKKYPQIELVLVLAYLNTGRDVSGPGGGRALLLCHRLLSLDPSGSVSGLPLPRWGRRGD